MNCLIPLAMLWILWGLDAEAQTRSGSPAKPFGPALVVESSLHADGGDAILEAGERARLRAIVTNLGSMTATDAKLSAWAQPPPVGFACTDSHEVGILAPGASKEIVFEYVVGDSVPAQDIRLLLQAHDGSRRNHPIDTLQMSTAASMVPSFRLAWHLEHPEAGIVEAVAPGDTVYFVLHLVNDGGAARGVSLHLEEWAQSRPLDWTDTLLVIGNLAAGDSVTHRILLAIDSASQQDTARARVAVLEDRLALTHRWEMACPLGTAAQRTVRRGTAAFQRGDASAALALYTEAVKQDPGLAQAHLLQGLVYEYLGDKKRCVPSIRRAAELGDSIALAWMKEHEQLRGPSVEYVRLHPDPFANAEQGSGLAVLSFERGEGSDIAERMYQKLASSTKARDRFTLYSVASLEEQQEALGLTSLDPESGAVRRALREVDIRFVVYGAVADDSPLAITLRCVRTEDGATLLSENLQESAGSTALDDAVRLLAEGRRPVYRER